MWRYLSIMISTTAFMDDALLVQICTTFWGPLSSIYFSIMEAWYSAIFRYPMVSIAPKKCSMAEDTSIALKKGQLVTELHPSTTIVLWDYKGCVSLVKNLAHALSSSHLSASWKTWSSLACLICRPTLTIVVICSTTFVVSQLASRALVCDPWISTYTNPPLEPRWRDSDVPCRNACNPPTLGVPLELDRATPTLFRYRKKILQPLWKSLLISGVVLRHTKHPCHKCHKGLHIQGDLASSSPFL